MGAIHSKFLPHENYRDWELRSTGALASKTLDQSQTMESGIERYLFCFVHFYWLKERNQTFSNLMSMDGPKVVITP